MRTLYQLKRQKQGQWNINHRQLFAPKKFHGLLLTQVKISLIWNILTLNGKHWLIRHFFHSISTLGLNFLIKNDIDRKIWLFQIVIGFDIANAGNQTWDPCEVWEQCSSVKQFEVPVSNNIITYILHIGPGIDSRRQQN